MPPLKEDKRERFAREYLQDHNGTQAAVRAGYSQKSAHVTASRLLSDAKVSERIHELTQQLHAKLEKKTEITRERVLQEYAKLAFFDPRKLFDEDGNPKKITELDDDTAGAIAGLEVNSMQIKGEAAVKDADADEDEPPEQRDVLSVVRKYKISDKRAALDSIAKHLGMFAPIKHEVTGKDGAPLMPEVSDQELARRTAFLLARACKQQESDE